VLDCNVTDIPLIIENPMGMTHLKMQVT